MWAGIA